MNALLHKKLTRNTSMEERVSGAFELTEKNEEVRNSMTIQDIKKMKLDLEIFQGHLKELLQEVDNLKVQYTEKCQMERA